MKRKRLGEDGYSILGVMVAAGVMCGCMLMVSSALGNASSQVTHQKMVDSGVHVGQSALEALLLVDDSDPQLTTGSHSAQFDLTGRPVAGGAYNVSWTVTPNTIIGSVFRIDLKVDWTEKGKAKTITLVTYKN